MSKVHKVGAQQNLITNAVASGAHREKNKRIMEPNKGFGLGLSWLIQIPI